MIPEERLREAAQEAGRIIANRYPDPEACQHTFSPEFEAKMERLLRRAARRERLVLAQRVARRVACLLLVLLLGCGTWLGAGGPAEGIKTAPEAGAAFARYWSASEESGSVEER